VFAKTSAWRSETEDVLTEYLKWRGPNIEPTAVVAGVWYKTSQVQRPGKANAIETEIFSRHQPQQNRELMYNKI
jgi:hypothetical protein